MFWCVVKQAPIPLFAGRGFVFFYPEVNERYLSLMVLTSVTTIHNSLDSGFIQLYI